MKRAHEIDLSFEGVAVASRREMMKLTPGQRINRAVELAELSRLLAQAGARAKQAAGPELRRNSRSV